MTARPFGGLVGEAYLYSVLFLWRIKLSSSYLIVFRKVFQYVFHRFFCWFILEPYYLWGPLRYISHIGILEVFDRLLFLVGLVATVLSFGKSVWCFFIWMNGLCIIARFRAYSVLVAMSYFSMDVEISWVSGKSQVDVVSSKIILLVFCFSYPFEYL